MKLQSEGYAVATSVLRNPPLPPCIQSFKILKCVHVWVSGKKAALDYKLSLVGIALRFD